MGILSNSHNARLGAIQATAGLENLPMCGDAPRVRFGQVLYLDFDGVLHHEDVRRSPKRGIFFGPDAAATGRQHQLFEHAGLLIELLAPYPQVRIVLSTSWVVELGYNRARSQLPAALQQRCVGGTFHRHMDRYRFKEMSRGQQVWVDVTRRTPEAWLAIDDDGVDWPAWCRDKLVHSDPAMGISSYEVRMLLEQQFAESFAQEAKALPRPGVVLKP